MGVDFFCGDFIIKSFSFDEAKSPRRQACNAFSATASGTISTTILTTISTPIFTPIFTPLSPPFLPPCNVPSDVLGWLGAAWGLTALAQFDPSQSKAIQKVLGRSTAIRLVRANQKQPTSCGTAAGRNENTQKLLISGIPSIPSDHTCEAHQSHSSRGRFFVSPESQGRNTCARTTIHFHPFFILLSADPDKPENPRPRNLFLHQNQMGEFDGRMLCNGNFGGAQWKPIVLPG